MGLTVISGEVLHQSEVAIAKNYLTREELSELNRIVTMFLDHAEDMARQHTPMYMEDWAVSLDEFLTFRKRNILQGYGKVSNEKMERLVLAEYAKYKARLINIPILDSEDDDLEVGTIIKNENIADMEKK